MRYQVVATVVAVVCFLAALALAYGWSLGGTNWQEWVSGGLVAFAAAHLP